MSILDPNWKYTPSNATDIRKLFAKVRKQLAERQKQDNVSQIKERRKHGP